MKDAREKITTAMALIAEARGVLMVSPHLTDSICLDCLNGAAWRLNRALEELGGPA